VKYIRPIKQSKPDKRAEHTMRKTYKTLDQTNHPETQTVPSDKTPDRVTDYDDSLNLDKTPQQRLAK